MKSRILFTLSGLLGLMGSVLISGCSSSEGVAESESTLVGAYYYAWYSRPRSEQDLGRWNQSIRVRLQHRQLPAAGLYSSEDPEVIRTHIRQSIQAGIDFWAVSWWGPDKDQTFRESILNHPDHQKLKYAVLYESTGRLGTFAQPDYSRWISDFEHLRQHYFDQPSYLKINNRPVVFVYLTREYFRNRGEAALRMLRERFPEVYLVGDDIFFIDGQGEYQSRWAANFDAITAYDVYGQSIKPLGGTREAVATLSRNYAQARQAAHSVETGFIPAIAPGYNDLPTRPEKRHPGRARYFTDVEGSREGDVFRAMIAEAALPHLDPKADNMLMITSFNEWLEDSQIESTSGTEPPSNRDDSVSGTALTQGETYFDYGDLYLDILREMVPR
ncbi:MAG: hypothetical protein AAGH72_05915 [Verrucomicrobiota bacterium]